MVVIVMSTQTKLLFPNLLHNFTYYHYRLHNDEYESLCKTPILCCRMEFENYEKQDPVSPAHTLYKNGLSTKNGKKWLDFE